jgi:hypothetical protein
MDLEMASMRAVKSAGNLTGVGVILSSLIPQT